MSDCLLNELMERLEYIPETGELIWRWSDIQWFKDERAQKIWNTRYAGKPATHQRRDGRLVLSVRGRKMFAHRVAYALHNGCWPEGETDHINGDNSDNRAKNLRAVSKSGNMRNQKRNSTNTSGHTGVVERGDKWGAMIGTRSGQKWLGTYACKTAALVARKAAEVKHGYHPNHGRASA